MYKFSEIFEVNEEIKSYTYPIIKIVVCFVLYLILLKRNGLFSISGRFGNFIITFLVLVITIAAVFCVYISVVEIIELHNRRKDAKRDVAELATKYYLLDDIIDLIEKNDIIEIEIKTNQEVIKVGCNSDNKLADNIFFDKKYYCGDAEYETIQEFREKMLMYSKRGKIMVHAIDGIVES